MKNLLAIVLLFPLAACSIGPAPKDAASAYDLGAAPAAVQSQARIKSSLLVQPVGAPSWLDTYSIVYRLNYQDPARQLTYANSRWAAPAATLVTQRLRAQLATVSDGGVLSLADSARADYALRIDLEQFDQVFDSADASRGVIVARASIVNLARRSLTVQKTFTIEKTATSANAEGGVRALAAGSNELIDAIVAWTAASLAQDKK